MPDERPPEQDPTTASANPPAPETPSEATPETAPPETPPAQPVAAEVVSTPAVPTSATTGSTASSTPSTTPTAPAAPDNSPLIGERLQQFWQKAGPIVLVSGISVLRVLVSVLTSGLSFLEKTAPEEAKAAPTVAGLTEKADPVVQKAKPVLTQLWQLWLKLLQWLRSVAPENWRRQLNSLTDNVLTGLIVGALLLVFWFWGLITPDQSPAAARTAAKRPPEMSRSARPQAQATPQVARKPLRSVPSPAPSVAPSIAAKPVPTPRPKPSPVAIPSPKPSPVAAPSPTPSPVAAKPSSEQARLADLRTKLAKVGNTYGDGLVQDLSVSPSTGSLRVQLKDKWYDLNATQQDQLAQELFQNSASADFSKLELADASNRLVARSPLVGTEVIILRRSLA
jgi:hypothetical protein